uniref:MAM domain-containing protein n=1 Tax=Parastrongyloides trichosuri TaxID=131310 RepID=A0A0N4ZSM0_PARTI
MYIYNLFYFSLSIIFTFPTYSESCGALSTDTFYKLSGNRILKGYDDKDPIGSIIGMGQQAIEPFITSSIPFTTTTIVTTTNIITENIQSIQFAEELNCPEFDDSCLWKNLDGYMVDEMDWYQGNGFLNDEKLFLASGTKVKPIGNYGIVATDKLKLPSVKSVLISTKIDCLTTSGTLKFKYWTSPEVKIIVCIKRLTKIYPDYDYCSPPIENGDPGPAIISIPDINKEPFQIFIRAENFVFKSGDLEGGFAIIDDIEFEGEICNKYSIKNYDSSFSETNSLMSNFQLSKRKGIIREVDGPVNENVCHILTCNFENKDICINYAISGDFIIVKDRYKNIVRDASTKKNDENEGFYAVVEGPKTFSRLTTQSFTLDDEVYFMFSYHKVSPLGRLRLIRKVKEKNVEEILFESPSEGFTVNKWIREGRTLTPGEYDYLAIEVTDLPMDTLIGIDEWFLLTMHKNLYCV